jgi:DNA polymerase-3 subunit gamma/tau
VPATAPPPARGATGNVPAAHAPVRQAIGGGARPVVALLPDDSPISEPAPLQVAATGPAPVPEPPPWEDDGAVTMHDPATFQAVIDLADALREVQIYANLRNNVHLVRFEPGHIEFRPTERAPADLAPGLSRFLNTHTVRRWVVSVSREPGAATLQQQAEANAAEAKAKAADHPLVRSVMEAFPGASIAAVRSLAPPPEKLGEDIDDAPPPDEVGPDDL